MGSKGLSYSLKKIVAISVTLKDRAQSTVVSVLDAKLGFLSRPHTMKLKNIERTGPATVTVVKLDPRDYVTVEGVASRETGETRQRTSSV